MESTTGPTNSLVDVAGLRVGHASLDGDGRLSGVTVVLCPPGGAVGGVSVRGGGPGTRETDILSPVGSAPPVHAVTLAGSSAFGLSAADGVMRALREDGVGLPVGPPGVLVPIVPAAVVYDLGRAGDPLPAVTADTGRAAYVAARDSDGTPPPLGTVGAGTGALAGGLKGGVGTASAVVGTPGGDGDPARPTVAALAVVNAAGSAVDPTTGGLYGAGDLLPDDDPPPLPDDAEAAAARPRVAAAHRHPLVAAGATLNTTLGVVATDATLSPAQCTRLADTAHDGLARAIRPAHAMVDGDTVVVLATGSGPTPDMVGLHDLLAAAADVLCRAIGRGVLAAATRTTAAGTWLSYRDAFPSAFSRPTG